LKKNKKLSLVEVIAMAVGTMIGASIFSIFGLGVKLAGVNLPWAFLLSGVYAMAVAYSYAILGRQIISDAGPMAFILKGFGDNIITGTLSILYWFSFVVSIALFANGFAGYFIPLVHIEPTHLNHALVMAGLILFFTSLNFFGSKAVGKAEFWIVLIKLSILLLFIIAGFKYIQWDRLTPQTDPAHLKGLLNASIVFFLSYMGFGLVTNVSENMENPQRNVPRAIYISIFIVMLFYIGISVVTLGNLDLDEIIKASENALAVAAEPFLGHWGYLLVSIGAVISISSALNATIYGGANIAFSLAKEGYLPEKFERKVWFNAPGGLYITAGLGLFLALFFNLNAIAVITTAVTTLIYVFVLIAHYKNIEKYGGKKWIVAMNLGILSFVFLALMRYQWQTQRDAFTASWIIFAGAFILEVLYRKFFARNFKKSRILKNNKTL